MNGVHEHDDEDGRRPQDDRFELMMPVHQREDRSVDADADDHARERDDDGDEHHNGDGSEEVDRGFSTNGSVTQSVVRRPSISW